MSKSEFTVTAHAVPKIKTKYRNIQTKMPAPGTEKLMADLEKYESSSMHGQMPIAWDKAKDFSVWDIAGNKFIDFTSGIFVTNAGHGNPRILKAIKEIAAKPLLHAYNYPTTVRRDYLKYLIEHTPEQFEKAFLLSSGTEACEAALKLMRMVGTRRGKRRPGIIAFEGNYHGRTVGAQMMSWNKKQKEWIGYDDPNIFHLPFPYPWRADAMADPKKYFLDSLAKLAIEKKIDPTVDIAGFMLETFQGKAAVFYPKEFVQAISEFAKQHNILVAFDEMQAGFGRTGKLFGYMHYDVEPDILACGKGASSGAPLSIVLGSRNIMDSADVGSMSSTHSANPLVSAIGLANLKALLEDGLIKNAEKLGIVLHERLAKIKGKHADVISDTLGMGLVASIIFTKGPERTALTKLKAAICERALERGLIVVQTSETIKIGPPLTITEDALLEGLAVIETSIEEIKKEHSEYL